MSEGHRDIFISELNATKGAKRFGGSGLYGERFLQKFLSDPVFLLVNVPLSTLNQGV